MTQTSIGIPVDYHLAREVARRLEVAEDLHPILAEHIPSALADVLTELAGPDALSTERLHEIRGRVRGLLDLGIEVSKTLRQRGKA
jgi:hypothetical protein